MSTAGDLLSDMIQEARESWVLDPNDPKVLELPGEREPVVAAIHEDRLRVLHSGIVYAREVTEAEVLHWLTENDGRVRLGRLSDHSTRFDKRDFLNPHPDASPNDSTSEPEGNNGT